MHRFALFVLALAAPVALRAQEAEVPAPVARGLELLRSDSASAAVEVWAAAWTGPGDAGKTAAILAGLQQVRELGGPMRAYDVLGVQRVGPHLRRVFVLLRYDHLPVYAQLVAYDRGTQAPSWMVSTVSFNTDPQQILPSSYWER